ncbi:putative phosphomannomutase [Leucosporidium creatinivorum]|uniref:Phosphomannomutase n=1 Tax=Leucosporidium creatinivorum TaxID=106004 RepID=A0A1Y2EC54_9BASI|nr:putative phosphomannomutase [Leucosporidium creatinivorum]
MSPVPFADRPLGSTLVLFDVDETLTPTRQPAGTEILAVLKALREKAVIGFVGGSDLPKITEQLAVHGQNMYDNFDYCFAENGLVAYKWGEALEAQAFIRFLGEEKYKKLVKFLLHYLADVEVPVRRGTFVEFRTGMINVSPVGGNATPKERLNFEAYDKVHKVRETLIEALKNEFPDWGLTYSIGGPASFDIYPVGWDKTFALRHVEKENFVDIHFFGDRTYPGGNDFQLFHHPRTIGHTVTSPEDTIGQLKALFDL